MASILLINEPPLQLLSSLAKLIGVNEAIILQQVHYWITNKYNNNLFEGRKWVYNTYEQWREQFPFWSKRTIERTIINLEKRGILLSREGERRLKYYSIDYAPLNDLLMTKSIQTITSNCHPEVSRQSGATITSSCGDSHDKVARSYIDTETTTKITTERGDAREREPNEPIDVSMSGHFVPTPPQEGFQKNGVKKGTALDINWTLPDRWREWAIELGMMNEEIDLTEVNFRDYWISTVKNRTKNDWFATWRGWCRRDRQDRKLPLNLKKSSLSSTPKEPERQTSQRSTGKFERSDDPRIQKWHELQPKLRDRVGMSNYESWFERQGNIELIRADSKAIFRFGSGFHKEHIWKQFSSEIAQTLAEIDPKLGLQENIELIV